MSSEEYQRLLALLQIESEGEQIAEMLSKILVDRDKRTLLLVRLREIEETARTLGQEVSLTSIEKDLKKLMEDAKKPLNAQEVAERATGSLSYRQHASAALNSLVDKGVLGKLRGPGRTQYFAPALEAVKQTITQQGQSPDDFDPQSVAESTELSLAQVLELSKEI